MTPLFNYIPAVLCLMALIWACLVWLKVQRTYLGWLTALLCLVVVVQFISATKLKEQEMWGQLALLSSGLLCLLVVYLVERLTYSIIEGETGQQETKADWLSLVDRAPFGYFQKDINGQYTFINHQLARWLEQTRSALVGKSDVDIFPEEIAETHFVSDQQALATGEIQESLEDFALSNGEMLLLHLVKYPRFNASKETIGVQGIFWDITSNHNAEQEQLLQLSQLRNLLAGFRQLAEQEKSIFTSDAPFMLIARQVTLVAAKRLDVERAGVWVFDKNQKELKCVDQYDRSTDSRINDLKFAISGCPAYFAAINAEGVIAASDARHDPRTHELSSRYYNPMGVHSSLSATIRVDGKMRGILTFEQTTGRRNWTEDEANFAETLAAYIAQTLHDDSY